MDQGGGGFSGNVLNHEAAGEAGRGKGKQKRHLSWGSEQPLTQRQAVPGRPLLAARASSAPSLSGTASHLLSWRPHRLALWSLSFPQSIPRLGTSGQTQCSRTHSVLSLPWQTVVASPPTCRRRYCRPEARRPLPRPHGCNLNQGRLPPSPGPLPKAQSQL